MIHINAAPKSVFSLSHILHMENAPPISMEISWSDVQGFFEWEGVNYDLYCEKPYVGDFIISEGGKVTVRAIKKSPLDPTFTVPFGNREFRLLAAHSFARGFILWERGNAVGKICPYFLSRKWKAEFPDRLPVPVCVFLFWLAVSICRRQTFVIASR